MSRRTPLADRIRAALADEPSTREVRMFGALSFLVDEKIAVATQKSGDLLVRVDPARNCELLALPGVTSAEMSGRTMGPSWIRVAPATLVSDDDLSFWTNVALEAVHRLSAGS